jgi:hypothetical protein
VRRPRRSGGWVGRFTLALVALGLGARSALAAELQEQPKVAVRVQACSPSFEAALRRMLALELGELLADARPETTRPLESIEVVCEAERANISARSVAGDQVAHNDLRFDAFPRDAAPRAVALAALEALRAVDPALTSASRRNAPKPRQASRPAQLPARRPPSRRSSQPPDLRRPNCLHPRSGWLLPRLQHSVRPLESPSVAAPATS